MENSATNVNLLIDYNQFEKEWKQKEKELMESEAYKSADQLAKNEMLYMFDCYQNDSITQAMKESNQKLNNIKNAFHLLLNCCKSNKSGVCKNCILRDLTGNFDEECLLDTFQNYNIGEIDKILENNISELQKQLNKKK